MSRVDELVPADPWPWRGDVCLRLVLLPNVPFPQPVSSLASGLEVYARSTSSGCFGGLTFITGGSSKGVNKLKTSSGLSSAGKRNTGAFTSAVF